jgi:xylulokinase
MYLLGYDIGSSSVKVCLIEASSGKVVASEFSPKKEMKITAIHPGWAEQNPVDWWTNLKLAHEAVMHESGYMRRYQGNWYYLADARINNGDKDQNLLRPSIIWCDSRAVPYGEKAFKEIGEENVCRICLIHQVILPLQNWLG